MPKEYPNFSQDIERMVKTGRVKDEAEAEGHLASQKRLIQERQEARRRVKELHEQARPSEEQIRKELERRLEILKQAYERRQARLREHFKKMFEAGVSPFHEELQHQRERLSQIENDFERERGLFEQFDAEERLVGMHEYGLAVTSQDPKKIKEAQRKLEDILEEQGMFRSFEREGRLAIFFRRLRAWARGEIKMESDGKEFVDLIEYRGRRDRNNEYVEEPMTDRLMGNVGCPMAQTKDGFHFCFECEGTWNGADYETLRLLKSLR